MSKNILISIARLSLVLFIIIWGVIVFKLSSQNGAQSGKISGRVIEKILVIKDKVEAVKNEYNKTGEINLDAKPSNDVTNSRIYRWQKTTRKFAHYILYTFGSFLIYLTLTAFESKNKKWTLKKILITLILGVGYGISDEFHQGFSAGRTPKLIDVGIDSLGVITGILLGVIVIYLLNKIIDYMYERRKVND